MTPSIDTALHDFTRTIRRREKQRRSDDLSTRMQWMTTTPVGLASTHYQVAVTMTEGPTVFFMSITPGGDIRYTAPDGHLGVLHHTRMECERLVRVVDNHNLTMAAGTSYDDGDRVGIIVHPFSPAKQ